MSIMIKSAIFIPSKNRADKQSTFEILKSVGLDNITNIVVEPQDYEEYKKLGYPVIKLPENDKGISYSRNFILDYCRKNGIEYCIQMDDDIQAFYLKEGEISGKKMKKDNFAILEAIEIFENTNTYMGLEYQQFAWASGDKLFTENRGIEVIHFMYLPNIPENIRFDKNTKEDKDFCIQALLSGIKTVKINYIAMSVPSIGTNKGGLHEWYASKGDNLSAVMMLKKWGSRIIKLKKKDNGRIDAMIQWGEIQKIISEKKAGKRK